MRECKCVGNGLQYTPNGHLTVKAGRGIRVDEDGVSCDAGSMGVSKEEVNKILNERFAILYPNSGSADEPASVTINSRYVMSNPFPGHSVMCRAEVLYAGKWGNTGFGQAFIPPLGEFVRSYGVAANQLEDEIVIQTGRTYLLENSSIFGDPFDVIIQGGVSTLPCRVKVWRID